MGETAVTSVSVPITMSGLSMREVTSSMKKLRMFKAMNEPESAIQSLYGIQVSVSLTCSKLAHTQKTLLENIDKWLKSVLDDRAPHLLDEERE